MKGGYASLFLTDRERPTRSDAAGEGPNSRMSFWRAGDLTPNPFPWWKGNRI